ncbi:35912_t:CDS:1, partial [Racocetra persica]
INSSLPNKLWKAIAFSLFIDLQKFAYKNLISNVKSMNDDASLQTSDRGILAIKRRRYNVPFESISDWLLAFKAYMDA